MTRQEKRTAIKEFVEKWRGRGREDEDDRSFWLDLLFRVLGVSSATDHMTFQNKVVVESKTKSIDAYLPETKVLIEQKSAGVALDKKARQSDGAMLTPYEQAKRYADNLPYAEKPRWIVTSNFGEIWIYDLNTRVPEPFKLALEDLPAEAHRLAFLADAAHTESLRHEMTVSLQAGELVGAMYDLLLKQYRHPEEEATQRALNKLCVRLVFCLYAEDAGIFGKRDLFHDYLAQFDARGIRQALIRLFEVLNQPADARDPYLAEEDRILAVFPYVNGGLFAEAALEIPLFTEELRTLLLTRASDDFNWAQISPTIFGAVFESTLNPQTRRSGGMHYTSVENIHKVIDPLFLDELNAAFEAAKAAPLAGGARTKALRALKTRLAKLTFLDPACGSGNFLTETYLSLRRLENAILREDRKNTQGVLNFERDKQIEISIGQFYGIEINDFAVAVARTALWIAESQMMRETEDIVQADLDFLPLKTDAHLVEGNALRLDWNDVIPADRLSYIMGNPPFTGYTMQSAAQKEDMATIAGSLGKNLDYVSCWFIKAAQMIQGTGIRAALVATNSITQGEQVAALWQPLFTCYGAHIDFGWRTFQWDSEARDKAHVHCVIVGFSTAPNVSPKIIHDTDGTSRNAANINAYLLDAPDIFVQRRNRPLCAVPAIFRGSQPTDGGNLILTDEEKEVLLAEEPQARPFIRPFMMGKDFIERKPRFCLWLVGADPATLKQCPQVLERVKKVREFRQVSSKAATRIKADTPMLFDDVRNIVTDYIAIPQVSSENRRYVPIDYLSAEIIAGNMLFALPDATLFHFGVLTSSVHMAWMRAVCGRLKSDYRYSKDLVYNTFPWPEADEAARAAIEKNAQGILDARAHFPGASFADLYDPLTMPPELLKAHQANDRAVMVAYGFKKDMVEGEIVATLMRRYREMVEA
ncbi:MAG: class I SAM-dependent DNA methyltransferase [Clostridia bacterium]|nr:class I SAM-dependent DNA methyltransferase [Clostridia bacterium]